MENYAKYFCMFIGWAGILIAGHGENSFIAAGENHSLLVKSDGTVVAWGLNSFGQLGDGRGGEFRGKYSSRPQYSTVPVQVISLSGVIAVSGGNYHSLALKNDGTVWAWGDNGSGELGNGTTMDANQPVQAINLSGVIAIASGGSHSLALKSDGTVWAWGYNNDGALGNGTYQNSVTPTQVIGGYGLIQIAAGLGHSLFLLQDGTVWACGLNEFGQLGDGTTSDAYQPVQVVGLSEVIAVSGGIGHSLALKRNGTVWAWGWNGSGQLGDGTTNCSIFQCYSVVPVQVINLSNVTAIAGAKHSLALKNDGTVWAWGDNEFGQLGDGTTLNTNQPVQVVSRSGVIAIAAGWHHSRAITVDGTVWAWGRNEWGQLGDGTTTDRLFPVQVQGVSGIPSSAPASVMAADFDADGKADPTAISSSGELFFWNSSQSFSRDGPMSIGLSSSVAVGDADGDGKADMATVDSSGNWYFYLSSRGYLAEAQNLQPSVNSPQPLLADFDGDGKADPAIVSATGVWYFWLSADGYSPVSAPFAISGATPVAADFDADGRADPVMVSSSGDWHLWPSSQMYTQHGPYNFGVTGLSAVADKPVAGDFDGDGRADPAMVDSSGNWNLFLSDSFYTRNGPWYLVLP